jgi:hypothetical protein
MLKVGVPLVNETVSLKIRAGLYGFGPPELRGNPNEWEPGKGKGRILARRMISMNARLVSPRILLVSCETIF